MAVTEGAIDVGTTGEKLDTTKVTQTDETTAHREAVVLTDPETLAARAGVKGTEELSTRYALQVQDDKIDDLISAVHILINQVKITNIHLYAMTDEVFDPQDIE